MVYVSLSYGKTYRFYSVTIQSNDKMFNVIFQQRITESLQLL